jgi:hypothetical protein
VECSCPVFWGIFQLVGAHPGASLFQGALSSAGVYDPDQTRRSSNVHC